MPPLFFNSFSLSFVREWQSPLKRKWLDIWIPRIFKHPIISVSGGTAIPSIVVVDWQTARTSYIKSVRVW